MHYLTSCSIIKNEPRIKDFIKIHRALGVQHFLLFDRSDISLKEVLKDEKDVTVVHFPEPNRHAEAWAAGAKFLLGKSKWVQFIDADQVLFPTKTNDIKEFLQNYEDCPILGLNWHTFGSNGHETEPSISDYEAYTRRAKGNILPNNSINDHIQTVCQPSTIKLERWNDPHHPTPKSGFVQHNEYKKILPPNSPFNRPATQDFAFIAHYYTKSREEYLNKFKKNRADTGTAGDPPSNFDHHQNYMNEVEDIRIKEFWEKNCK